VGCSSDFIVQIMVLATGEPKAFLFNYVIKDGCLLGCSTMYSGRSLPMFQMSLLLPTSGQRVRCVWGISFGKRNQSGKAEPWPDQWGIIRWGSSKGKGASGVGGDTAWPGGESTWKRERFKEAAVIRAPRGSVRLITGHREVQVDGRRRVWKWNIRERKCTK
jgi:hypothetical protein